MSKDTGIHEILPKLGFLFEEDSPATIVSKPKLMPLKTVTLEKVSLLSIYFLEITTCIVYLFKNFIARKNAIGSRAKDETRNK